MHFRFKLCFIKIASLLLTQSSLFLFSAHHTVLTNVRWRHRSHAGRYWITVALLLCARHLLDCADNAPLARNRDRCSARGKLVLQNQWYAPDVKSKPMAPITFTNVIYIFVALHKLTIKFHCCWGI
jgi:hypothetical protein